MFPARPACCTQLMPRLPFMPPLGLSGFSFKSSPPLLCSNASVIGPCCGAQRCLMTLCFQRHRCFVLSEASTTSNRKNLSGLNSFIFMHHFLVQFSVRYCCLPGTAVDGLLFLVGFSTASAKLIPQLFLQGLHTSLLSYTPYCINFYFPRLLWAPPCEKVKEQLRL